MKSLSHVQLFVTPWTVAYQAPPFMGFSRQEYWSGLPFPSPIATYRFNATLIKFLMAFFHRNRKNNSKTFMELKHTHMHQIAKTILRKNNKPRGIMCSDFKLYYKDL